MKTKMTSFKLIQFALSVWMLMVMGICVNAQTAGATYIAVSNEKKVLTKSSKDGDPGTINCLSVPKRQLPAMTKPESSDSIPKRKISGEYKVLTK